LLIVLNHHDPENPHYHNFQQNDLIIIIYNFKKKVNPVELCEREMKGIGKKESGKGRPETGKRKREKISFLDYFNYIHSVTFRLNIKF